MTLEPDEPPGGDPALGRSLTRRRLLQALAFGAGAGAVGVTGWELANGQSSSTPHAASSAVRSDRDRVLVVVELAGGNDGWSTVIPYESGHYRSLRPTLAIGGDRVIDWGGGWGLNRQLAGLADRGLTAFAGVGTSRPDLSHFEMLNRWHSGDPRPTAAHLAGGMPTGFLGRLCDVVGDPGRLSGVSLSWGDHPSLRAAHAATVSLGTMSNSPFADATRSAQLRAVVRDLTTKAPTGPIRAATASLGAMQDVLELMRTIPPTNRTYPDTEFGDQMAFVSRLLRSRQQIRVIHVPFGASQFDTHADHEPAHDQLLAQLDAGLSAFVDDLAAQHLDRDVLIATTSEFGRRPAQNGNGLDHGTASTMLLLGPTTPGLQGEASPVDRFDELGNLIATIEFDRYYASLATWLGVDPAQVLRRSDSGVPVRPVGDLVRA